MTATAPVPRLIEQFEHGLDAPICLTWELTYACNLSCVHCLSSSGKRDPRELSTQQCKDIIDELERMQVFYVNIGGGEPTVRRDIGALASPEFIQFVDAMPKTTSGKIIRRMLRKIAGDSYEDIGDTTSLAEPDVIGKIIEGHRNLVAGRHETESAPQGEAAATQE